MLVLNDMSYCAHKECTNTKCFRNQSNIDWDKLPEWMGVSIADFGGKYPHCPADLEEVKWPSEDLEEDDSFGTGRRD